MGKSNIEWTDETWNPVTGCTKISPGCKLCYAERLSGRLKAMGQAKYRNGFKLTLHEHELERPLHWKKPRMIFVCSMSDLFHEAIPTEFIGQVCQVMRRAPWHTFQVLTKRVYWLEELSGRMAGGWPPNVWAGTSIENDQYAFRADHLRHVQARVRFLSIEPMLGPLPSLNLDGIHWVIVGGESGPGARPMNPEWVRDIRNRCQAAEVPFFFKQWGGANKKAAGHQLDGREWRERPE